MADARATTAVGGIEVASNLDAVGRLGDVGELYPEVGAEEWRPYRELYPSLFEREQRRLRCGCFLIRSDAATVLVDTGVGPAAAWDWDAEWEGGLPDGLEALGIRRDDVDLVFLTHLHIDHLGWNADTDGAVFFPRARYVVHRDAVTFARTRSELLHVARCVVGLLDRLEPVQGEIALASGVLAYELPGHDPGHMGVRIESQGSRLELIADMAVHPALLAEPDWVYVSDGDALVCAETRRYALPAFLDQHVLVACGHYPGSGIGRVITRDGRVVWEEAA